MLHSIKSAIFKMSSLFTLFCFSWCALIPSPVLAEISLPFLPTIGDRVELSRRYEPPIMQGMRFFANDPFRFDFIIDKGDSVYNDLAFKGQADTLIKYFLTSLTIPKEDLWVNLSPNEKNRIVPNAFGITEMGKDMLAQDYLLKQLTSSLLYPEDELGENFWEKVYFQAQQKFDTTDIPLNTINKVWIVPEKIVIYENTDAIYITESKLKVMLEEDYLSAKASLEEDEQLSGSNTVDKALTAGGNRQTVEARKLTSDIIRQIIIPAVEEEVNHGEHFTKLRQMYHSMGLATWYKRNLRASVFGQMFVEQNKINGVETEDKAVKEKIYEQYLEAFRAGVYNYVKEEYDPVTQNIIPRKYFSGGAGFDKLDSAMVTTREFPTTGRAAQAALSQDRLFSTETRILVNPQETASQNMAEIDTSLANILAKNGMEPLILSADGTPGVTAGIIDSSRTVPLIDYDVLSKGSIADNGMITDNLSATITFPQGTSLAEVRELLSSQQTERLPESRLATRILPNLRTWHQTTKTQRQPFSLQMSLPEAVFDTEKNTMVLVQNKALFPEGYRPTIQDQTGDVNMDSGFPRVDYDGQTFELTPVQNTVSIDPQTLNDPQFALIDNQLARVQPLSEDNASTTQKVIFATVLGLGMLTGMDLTFAPSNVINLLNNQPLSFHATASAASLEEFAANYAARGATAKEVESFFTQNRLSTRQKVAFIKAYNRRAYEGARLGFMGGMVIGGGDGSREAQLIRTQAQRSQMQLHPMNEYTLNQQLQTTNSPVLQYLGNKRGYNPSVATKIAQETMRLRNYARSFRGRGSITHIAHFELRNDITVIALQLACNMENVPYKITDRTSINTITPGSYVIYDGHYSAQHNMFWAGPQGQEYRIPLGEFVQIMRAQNVRGIHLKSCYNGIAQRKLEASGINAYSIDARTTTSDANYLGKTNPFIFSSRGAPTNDYAQTSDTRESQMDRRWPGFIKIQETIPLLTAEEVWGPEVIDQSLSAAWPGQTLQLEPRSALDRKDQTRVYRDLKMEEAIAEEKKHAQKAGPILSLTRLLMSMTYATILLWTPGQIAENINENTPQESPKDIPSSDITSLTLEGFRHNQDLSLNDKNPAVTEYRTKLKQSFSTDELISILEFADGRTNPSSGEVLHLDERLGSASEIILRALNPYAPFNTDLQILTQALQHYYVTEQTGIVDQTLRTLITTTLAQKSSTPYSPKPLNNAQDNAMTTITTPKTAPSIQANKPDNVGGIDFNEDLLYIETAAGSEKISVPLNDIDLRNVNISGVTPLILNVTPMTNLPMILGMNQKSDIQLAENPGGEI